MSKQNSDACFHYFSVPFDWPKAEVRWEMLFASRSETIEEREHRRAKMSKWISEACFHNFIMPFDWSKAELPGEVLFASRSETIEERARSESQRDQRLFACFEVRHHRIVKLSKKLVKLAFTILLCHLIDLKWNLLGKCYLLRGQWSSKSETIEKQKCWNELVNLAFTILLCHLIVIHHFY